MNYYQLTRARYEEARNNEGRPGGCCPACREAVALWEQNVPAWERRTGYRAEALTLIGAVAVLVGEERRGPGGAVSPGVGFSLN